MSILILFFIRQKLNKFPFIIVFIILGIAVNWSHYFKSFEDLCAQTDVNCEFNILRIENLIWPKIEQLLMLIPAAAVMAIVLVYEQFLYIEEFERRGKRFYGEGDLGNVKSETRVLGISNIIAGCFGGLPICINLFGTYENFTFNIENGYKGTKLVGVMQIAVSFAFYTVLEWFFNRIPLFVLFIVIATPVIYFTSNILKIHFRHKIFIIVLATLNVITHPILALILAAFISVYDISELLKGIPA